MKYTKEHCCNTKAAQPERHFIKECVRNIKPELFATKTAFASVQ